MPKGFQTNWVLKNPHIQTLFAPLFRKQTITEVQVEKFTLRDGDFVESVWNQQQPTDHRAIVILFHGLAGSIDSPYIQGLMKSLQKRGFASVVMHFRGCHREENLLPRAYHSGDTNDAKEWIDHLKKSYPNTPLHAVGFSIGGNMLLKLLGEWGKESPLSSAVCVSAPMQLEISANTIERGFAKLYQWHLLKPLKANLLNKYKRFDMKAHLGVDEMVIENIETIREFDERYTAVIHGFKSSKDYYKKSSAKQFLKDITTPTLIIHALDDPFMTPEVLPTPDELSPTITLEISKYGGHVGFVGGRLFRPSYWLDSRISNYIDLHNLSTKNN